MDRFPTPGVLDGSHGYEPGVAQPPGEGDVAIRMSADAAVKVTAEESRHFRS